MTRVLIRATDHSWYGETGILTKEKLPTGQYVILLDNGMHCAAFKYELVNL